MAMLATPLRGCTRQADQAEKRVKSPNEWLFSAEDDSTRFALIQRQLRGFDQPMLEVGERFERLHAALGCGNYPLAAYQWEKIRTAIENGIAKRPARGANAQALFLEPVWQDVHHDIQSGDRRRAWVACERAKAACQPAMRPRASPL